MFIVRWAGAWPPPEVPLLATEAQALDATASCAHADTRPAPHPHPASGRLRASAHAAMSVLLQLLQDNAPGVFTSLVVVLAGAYLLLTLRRIQAEGSCPFAGSSNKASVAAPPTAAGSAPAATQQRHRNAMVRLTLAELADFDGKDASKPLYVAVRGKIYDVSPGRSFYGPGGPYAVFAGKECARALAFMKVTPEDCSADLSGASEAQLQTLADWEAKFAAKYGVAGEVVPA